MATLCLLDNIVLPGFLAGLRPRPEVTARGEELMKRMGIAELAASSVTEVSGGQLQRAGICRALINDPGIVFADEPTGALNSATALQILDLLGQVHASGTTLVMVTHDAQVAVRADRVLVLVDGRIVEDLSLGRYEEAEAPSRLTTVTEALQRRSVCRHRTQCPPQPQPPPLEADAETSRRPSRLPVLCPGVTPCGAAAPSAVVTAVATATASTSSGDVCTGWGR